MRTPLDPTDHDEGPSTSAGPREGLEASAIGNREQACGHASAEPTGPSSGNRSSSVPIQAIQLLVVYRDALAREQDPGPAIAEPRPLLGDLGIALRISGLTGGRSRRTVFGSTLARVQARCCERS